MYLARFLNKVFKKGGFILTDADSKDYIIGQPTDDPIKLKILNKKLHYKLLFHPDLYFGEAYTNGDIVIENGSLTDFLDLALMNIGRNELNIFSYLLNKLRGSYRYLTNFNFIKKSKMNVSHHYDIKDDLYDLFLDPKRQYSCAYFKNENDSLETAQNNKIQHIIKKCKFYLATGKNSEEQIILNEILQSKFKDICLPLDDLSIKEILPIIKNCNLSICNDSSFSHLSAALGTKTITLMVDTPIIYGNYNTKMFPVIPDGEETVKHHTSGKDRINPQKIFDKALEILN